WGGNLGWYCTNSAGEIVLVQWVNTEFGCNENDTSFVCEPPECANGYQERDRYTFDVRSGELTVRKAYRLIDKSGRSDGCGYGVGIWKQIPIDLYRGPAPTTFDDLVRAVNPCRTITVGNWPYSSYARLAGVASSSGEISMRIMGNT